MCSFCDQRTISGAQHLPDGNEVRDICKKALAEVRSPENAEIAFFGGSFTAIPRDYMLELLTAASEFVGEGKFSGIRCSTRPDCIDSEVLGVLKKYGVTAIELGAQSMCDDVLEANERGHSADDVRRAAELIKASGFELGLQMMTGLYRSSSEADMRTAYELASLMPDTVRIYPVVVLRGTRLAELYAGGEYVLMPFDDMVRQCAGIMELFISRGIRVIKCGLHASEFVEKDMTAGYYHPAFRELCEMHIYRAETERLLMKENIRSGNVSVAVSSRCLSKAVGQKKANIEYFRERGIDVSFAGDDEVPVYECRLRR